MPSRRPPRGEATSFDARERAAWGGLLRVHKRLIRELDEELRSADGLRLSSFDVMIQLSFAPDRRLRMSELADAVLLTPSGITRLVEKLEGLGWVERQQGERDGRVYYARLTDAGLNRVTEASATHLAGVRARFLDRLSDDELEVLGDVFDRVLAAAPDDAPAKDDV
jgi:DNA-binding MarR family transcriptional regulator